MKNDENVWTFENGSVILKSSRRTEVYDESGLRFVIRDFMSDTSRNRFNEGIWEPQDFFKILEHLIKGLKLFYNNENC